MNYMNRINLLIITLLAALLFASCKKDPIAPTATITLTKEIVNVEPKSATIMGTFSYPGKIDSVWVTVADNEFMFNSDNVSAEMNGKNFIVTVSSLKTTTTYYYCYSVFYGASNPYKTDAKTFTTTDFKLPEVITAVVSYVGPNDAICGGDVADDGGATVSARGVCWGQKPEPTLEDNHSVDSCGLGEYKSHITGLLLNTKYYVRAYATNEKGTAYGNDIEFTTSAMSPSVKTISVTDIDTVSARIKCEVTGNGGSDITEKGVCWSTHQDPTLEDSHMAASGVGVGLYTCNLTGLTPSTKYYVRAYARNSYGLGFGEVLEFVTTNIISKPTVTTVEIKNIMALNATAVGNVSSDGGADITSRGFCWSKTANPTVQGSHVEVGGTTGSYESTLAGLEANTTYHVRAYAVNSKGVGYGEDKTFTTTEGLPSVTTSAVTDVTATSAKCGGNVTDQGASNVSERGICWSVNHNPTISDNHVSGGSGTGTYTCQMTGLTPDATYYVRAYAKNTQGVSYGAEVSFVALEGLPSVVTNDATDITSTTAKCGGNVTNQGASNVTERGVCWSTAASPTTADVHSSNGSGQGSFVADLTGLTPGTTYHVRAYARNTQGTSYGNEITFTTTASIPTVTTSQVTDITQTTAVGGGNVTSDGGSTVTERGICWSTTSNPTIDGSHSANGSGAGTFTANITGLTAGTTYHVRSYAVNSAGTAYGSDVTFTTTATLPTVTTTQVSNITQTTALGGGNVTSDGGATVTERGVCWSLNANPTTSDQYATSGTGTGGFTVNMTGLTANTTYHVRAYAKNNQGTSYGSEVTFTTAQSISAPTVTTSIVINITQTTAVGGGNVTADGGASVTERGICWSTSQNPTTSGTHSNSGTGIGDYTVQMNGLAANTTYYVRAYAVNEAGTSYGNEVSFTTLVDLPVVTTSTVSNITQTTATGGGNVTSGVNVTERGICWSTTQNPTTSGTHSSSGTGIGSFTANMTGLSANTTYFVRAYVVNEVGTSYGNEVSFTTQSSGGGSIGGHEYVDLGLPSGLLWAKYNLGASNPENYGNYYAWGETATKSIYSWNTYQWFNNYYHKLTKYNVDASYGTVDNKIELEPNDDAAHVNWGNNWRMPTRDEMYELINYCTCEWTIQNGIYGRKVTGHNDNYIFLPASGYKLEGYLYDAESNGYYWSNSLYIDHPDGAYVLHLESGNVIITSVNRLSGISVRPVYSPYTKPIVSTSIASNITTSYATCGGNITSDGGNMVTARGVCWSTLQNPTIVQSHTTDGSGAGSFTSSITGLSPNTTYYVRAYATNNAGTSYGEQKVFSTLDPFNGHEYVDLGLPSGLLWATCNVGADSPEDYGDYFAWGETASKSYYDWSTYQWCNGSYNSITKYNTNPVYGIVDNKTVLELEDDAAHVNLGGNWRLPTQAEMIELKNNCSWEWMSLKGVNGRLVTGPNGNSIFLPASGYRYEDSFSSVGSYGHYWTSSLIIDSINAYYLRFGFNEVSMQYFGNRVYGQSVRPVCTISK